MGRQIFSHDVAPRNIYAISHNSLAKQLERLAWFGGAAPNDLLKHWHEQFQNAMRSNDPAPLHMETLSVQVNDQRTVTLPVSFLNTQFRAADAGAYPFGHDPEVLAMVDQFLPDDGTFYDIGASWGTFAFAVALRPGFRGNIHAFEPTQRSIRDQLSIYHALAPLPCNYELHQLALSDHAGEGDLAVSINTGGNTLNIAAHAGDVQKARLLPLDQVDLPQPHVVKIDVEGHEGAVLRGAEATIRKSQPVIIFENWLSDPGEIMTAMEPFMMLSSLGYSFYGPAWLGIDGTPLKRLAAPPRLALAPFDMDQRVVMAEMMNVLALPPGRQLESWDLSEVGDGAYPFTRERSLFG